MKETFEYIDLISQTIDKTIKIKSVVVNLDNTIDLQVNKTLWLTVSNRPIVIDNVEYKIKSIVNNALIKLEPNLTPVTATDFQAYDFYFWHGTIVEVNVELNKITASLDKFPMLYLVEVLEEENNTNDVEVVQRRVNARLLFATETDYTNNDTKGLYSTGIYPVRNFVNEFIYACENSPYINDLPDSYRSIPLTRIARYNANGHVSKLVNSELTGIELRIELPLTDCECCDVQPTTLALQGNENIFLTCGTLADCPKIQAIDAELADHEERIEALEEGGGGGLTCEDLPNCQVIQDIENEFGNYLPLAGGTMVVFNEFEQSSNNLTGSGFIISDLSVVNTIKAGYYELSNSITGFYKRIVIGNLINNNITINLPDSSGTLALLSDIATALTGYATEAWVNSQGFITNVITALGYTPENVANKATNLTSPDNTKYPTTQAVQTALDLKLSSLYTPLKSGFNIPHTGTVIKTLLNTIPIPPNKFATGDILRINYTISRNTGGAGGVNMICEIGGVVIINQNIAAANQISRGNIDMAIINAANSQRSWGNNTGNAQQNIGVLNVPMTAFTFDFTTALDFQIYGQMTSPSDTIVIESLSIEKI